MAIQNQSSHFLPSLSSNKTLRYFTFVALYFAQGIPEGMLAFGLPAWMAMSGKSPGEIAGFTAIAVLPWSLKFLIAPLMDRYTLPDLGRKRPWVITGQLGLVASTMYMAFIPEPLNHLNQFMFAAFAVSFFGAFQDVATDGMAIDIIPVEQQSKANGLMWGSKIIGMSLSLATGSWILNKYGYSSAMLVMALAIALIMIIPVLFRERAGEKLMPWTTGRASAITKKLQVNNWRLIFKSLFAVFSLRNSLILTIVLFTTQGSTKYISTLMPIFTVTHLGWTNVEYSEYYATAKLIGGIIGMLSGGFLIERFGKKRMMNFYFIGFILLISVFTMISSYWHDKYVIYLFMTLQNTLYTLASIGLFAIAMQCCWKKVSASQFTLYMTLANSGQMAFSALIGPIRAHFNWPGTLMAFALFIGLTSLIFQRLNIDEHVRRVEEWEERDRNREESYLNDLSANV